MERLKFQVFGHTNDFFLNFLGSVLAFSQQNKAFCVLQFAKTESWTCVQRAFRRKFEKEAPERKSIVRWHAKFVKDGCLCPSKQTGRPSIADDAVEQV